MTFVATLGLLSLETSAWAAGGGPTPAAQVEKLRASVEKDVGKVRKAIESKLDRHGVSKERRASIRKVMESEIEVVTHALEEAVSDGLITVRESEQVRYLTRHLRGRIKQRLQDEKEQRAKEAAPQARLGPEKPARDGAASASAAELERRKSAPSASSEAPATSPPEGGPKAPDPRPAGPPSSQPEPGDLRPQPYVLPAPAGSASP